MTDYRCMFSTSDRHRKLNQFRWQNMSAHLTNKTSHWLKKLLMHLNWAIHNVCDWYIDPHVCFFPTLSQDRAQLIPLALPEACPQRSERPVCARSPHRSRNGYPGCRRAMYGLTSVGCCYPGLSTDVKAHLYKTIGLPSLLYGIESVSLDQTLIKSLECAQSNIVKNIMGFNKRSHHSNLLHVVRIDNVETTMIRGILSFWYRIYSSSSSSNFISNRVQTMYYSIHEYNIKNKTT